jgi:predicted signal transduction protein with EAL and GGDEF domain
MTSPDQDRPTPDPSTFDECARLRERVAAIESTLEDERVRRGAAESQVERLASSVHRDPSTGLPNRAAFLEALQAALADGPADFGQTLGGNVVVLLVQVEDFASVDVGDGVPSDRVLAAMALRLLELDDGSGMVGRVSVDELAMVTVLTEEPDHLARLADRIGRAVMQPVTVDGRQVTVRYRAGLRLASWGQEADHVLRDAQGALYGSPPRDDSGQVVIFGSDRGRHVTGRDFEDEMRRGLREGHIEAWFQDLVDLASGRVVGAEALARWFDPMRGFISTSEFIEQAEDAHVIGLLTDRMLAEGCRWAAAHPEIEGQVHVNVSADDLVDVQLLKRVEDALGEAGLEPPRLCLEFTERVFVTENKIAFRNLRSLRELGVVLAIDDFGVQFASFARLRRFPADVIKIDRSFVVDIETNARDRNVVAGIVTMARALEMRTVAEGVETENEARILRDLGVDVAQGWLFGQARPAEVWEVARQSSASTGIGSEEA